MPNISATIPFYDLSGTFNLNDWTDGNGVTHLRTPGNDIIIYEGLTNPSYPVVTTEWTNSLIPQTTATSWDSDASVRSRLAFYSANLVVPEFQNMGVDFNTVHIATGGSNSQSYDGDFPNAFIRIGTLASQPFGTHDILAHELGHEFLFEFLDYDNTTTNRSLHEGIADIIGTYIESFVQSGQVDWIMCDDDNTLATTLDRDLSEQICLTSLGGETPHRRGLVIGHWYYAISTGIPVDDIPAIGVQTAMDILVEALNNLNDPGAGFPEMREQTLLIAETNFGICSPEYRAVRNAWDRVCVSGQAETCPCDSYDPPSLSSQSFTVACPFGSLNDLVLSSTPQGTVLIWSTDGDPSDGVSPHINPAVLLSGVYYAYFRNIATGCYSEPSNPVTVHGVSTQSIVIDMDETYDTSMEIYGNIYIEDGATLTVTDKIYLGPGVTIFVEDESKLLLDGGTLTACGMTWEGVRVAGQFDLGSYSPAGSSNLKRGYVELTNGAVIEKAIVGIDGRDLFVAGGDITPGMQFYHGGGKITISSGSIIQDCGIGVRLHRYGWGSVIGAGPSGPGYPIGYEDEPSAFSNSFFKNCRVAAIYSDQNIGLSLFNNEFAGNYTDYEGYLSSITAIENDFLSPLSILASEHPLIPGSIFTDNIFANSVLEIDGQGNTKRHIFKQNDVDASSLWLTGELVFGISENEFSNSGYVGLFTESTGENIRNWVIDNSFSGQKYAISIFGENDTKHLANCFSNTTYADIEINSGASIHMTQGFQQASAGNCFNYYGRIKTGNGISPFEYWTKDGYHASCQPVLNCKYPGACNGFTLSQSQEETEVDCETNIIGDPPSELNCECGPGLAGCTDAIASVRSSISGLGSSAGNDLLKAQYRRCLDKLIRTYVDTTLASGEVEDVIDFLSTQPEFRYRIMAYGIITHNLEYERSSDYLDTLATANTEEQAFINVQKIWLDYIMDMESFILSPTDSMKIRAAGEAFNPLAGYARTVFYKLTGEQITRDFIHTDSTVTPRSSSKNLLANSSEVSVDIDVWPNPLTGHDAEIQVVNPDPEKEYVLVIYDVIGTIRSTTAVSNEISHVPISDTPGIYFVCLLQNGELIQTKKIVKI